MFTFTTSDLRLTNAQRQIPWSRFNSGGNHGARIFQRAKNDRRIGGGDPGDSSSGILAQASANLRQLHQDFGLITAQFHDAFQRIGQGANITGAFLSRRDVTQLLGCAITITPPLVSLGQPIMRRVIARS